MTLYQFNGLDEMEQIEAIWKKGVLLGTIREVPHYYELYQIDSFYVEFKRTIGDPGYGPMRTFLNPDLLEKYLDQIKINKHY